AKAQAAARLRHITMQDLCRAGHDGALSVGLPLVRIDGSCALHLGGNLAGCPALHPVEGGIAAEIFKSKNDQPAWRGFLLSGASRDQDQETRQESGLHSTRGSVAISSLNSVVSRSLANSGSSISFCRSLNPSSRAMRMY